MAGASSLFAVFNADADDRRARAGAATDVKRLARHALLGSEDLRSAREKSCVCRALERMADGRSRKARVLAKHG